MNCALVRRPTTVPNGAHVTRIVSPRPTVTRFHAIIGDTHTDLFAPDGGGHLLELAQVVYGARASPLLVGQQQRHAYVLVGVGGAVRAGHAPRRTDLPIHDVVAVGIRDVLFGIGPDTVKQGFVRHHHGDQHPVTDAFRDRIIPIRVTENPVTSRARSGPDGPRIGDSPRVPGVVHGDDIGLKSRGSLMVRFDAIGVGGILRKGVIAGCRIDGRRT